jgi:hypothetical protein
VRGCWIRLASLCFYFWKTAYADNSTALPACHVPEKMDLEATSTSAASPARRGKLESTPIRSDRRSTTSCAVACIGRRPSLSKRTRTRPERGRQAGSCSRSSSVVVDANAVVSCPFLFSPDKINRGAHRRGQPAPASWFPGQRGTLPFPLNDARLPRPYRPAARRLRDSPPMLRHIAGRSDDHICLPD